MASRVHRHINRIAADTTRSSKRHPNSQAILGLSTAEHSCGHMSSYLLCLSCSAGLFSYHANHGGLQRLGEYVTFCRETTWEDYKEHGTRNKDESSLRRDETALSSPSLSSWSTPSSRSRDERSSSSSGSNDSGLSSRSSSSSGSPSSTSEKYSNSGSVETVFVKR
uniref:Uncharacterized protein n=1 Tax=Timema douglasi TaxID=61478 RepID=A0A7R8VS45_TIMDO|nr:unnamed protein product [Timema douglasi]